MRIQSTFLVVLLALLVTPVAHAQEASVVVSRMDSIIKQMEALKLEFATLAATLKPTGAVLGSQTSGKSVFTMSLANGETNDDIKRIQKLLATDPEVYPYGVASGFFGPKTEEGIKNFQTRFGLSPVGVVGPATKSLLELFFNAYPNENFPADVLKKGKPQVAGASTSVPPATPAPVIPALSTGVIEEITAKYDGEEAKVKVYFKNGTNESFTVEGDTKIEVVDVVAVKLGKTRAQILAVIEFGSASSKSTNNSDEFNVDVEVDDDEVTLTFEYDDEEYEVEVDSTDEDDVLEEVADELDEDVDDLDKSLVKAIKKALKDALKTGKNGDSDKIKSITAQVGNGVANVRVKFGDGEEKKITVKETVESEIIEEVAKKLKIDEDEVEDSITFKYEDVDEIRVEIKNGKALAYVEFEDGTVKRVRISSDNESKIIKKLADELREDEDDIEDWVEFDYLD